jgi:hypothetical protein
MQELHRIGIKFFAEESGPVRLEEFIPVFHHWIQQQALPDTLIDVADYRHVHAGPGTLLIAHEGNYGYDETGNRRGLIYYSKHKCPGNSAALLNGICRKALLACKLIEQAAEMQNRIGFKCNELLIFSNDRIAAPNTEQSYEAFLPALRGLLDRLYPGTEYKVSRETDPRERLTLHIQSSAPAGVDQLLARLENA